MQGAAADGKDDAQEETPIFEEHHSLLHGDNKKWVVIGYIYPL